MSFSPDNLSFVVGFFYGDTSIRRINDGLAIRQLSGQTPYFGNIAFSPDGNLVAMGAYRDVQLRRISDGALAQTFKYLPVQAMVSRSTSNEVTNDVLRRSGPQFVIWGLDISPDGNLLAAVYDTGDISVWRMNDSVPIVTFAVEDYGQRVKFSPDGKYLAVGTYQAIDIYNVNTWEHEEHLVGGDGEFMFSPDSKKLAWFTGKSSIEMWNVSTWSAENILAIEGADYTTQFAFLSNNTTLTVVTHSSLQLWDTVNKKLLSESKTEPDETSAMAISPNSQLAVTVGASGYLAGQSNYIWDVGMQQAIFKLERVDAYNGYYSCAFSPDGKLLVLAADDGTIRLLGIQP